MTDIFDTKILCKRCNEEMRQITLNKSGAQLRAVQCERCGDKIIHPADLHCLEQYKDLKGRTFNVKLRMVGNSHAISIPKEIVDFMNDMQKNMRMEMDDMVELAFEDFGKISLRFWEEER